MNDSADIVATTRKELFSVECTTCKARLKVRSLAAIGQILACPKCHSMVMVAPPPDWHPEGTAPPVAPPQPATEAAALGGSAGWGWKLWGATSAAAIVCGIAVFAVWRQLPRTEPPVLSVETPVRTAPAAEAAGVEETPVEEAPAPLATDAPPAAEAVATAPAVEQPAVESPIEQPAPSSLPVEAPPTEPETAATETPAEPEAAPQPEPAAPPVEDASTSEDLQRKLQIAVAGIDEPSIRLDALAELLGGMAACPITLDTASLEAAGLSGATSVTVQVEHVTIEAALTESLAPLGLSFEPRGKAIVIFALEK